MQPQLFLILGLISAVCAAMNERPKRFAATVAEIRLKDSADRDEEIAGLLRSSSVRFKGQPKAHTAQPEEDVVDGFAIFASAESMPEAASVSSSSSNAFSLSTTTANEAGLSRTPRIASVAARLEIQDMVQDMKQQRKSVGKAAAPKKPIKAEADTHQGSKKRGCASSVPGSIRLGRPSKLSVLCSAASMVYYQLPTDFVEAEAPCEDEPLAYEIRCLPDGSRRIRL